jgi:hypothetical protein
LFGLNVEGIYRLSGSVPHVNKLKNLFDTGVWHCFSHPFPPHRKLTPPRRCLWQPRLPQSPKLQQRRKQRGGPTQAILPGPARPAPDERELPSIRRSSQYVPLPTPRPLPY